MPAIENHLALLLIEVNRGRCTIRQVAAMTAAMTAAAPARVWSIANKGQICEGYAADLVLVDLNKSQTILNENQLTKCG